MIWLRSKGLIGNEFSKFKGNILSLTGSRRENWYNLFRGQLGNRYPIAKCLCPLSQPLLVFIALLC